VHGLASWLFYFVPTPYPREVTKRRCYMPNRNFFINHKLRWGLFYVQAQYEGWTLPNFKLQMDIPNTINLWLFWFLHGSLHLYSFLLTYKMYTLRCRQVDVKFVVQWRRGHDIPVCHVCLVVRATAWRHLDVNVSGACDDIIAAVRWRHGRSAVVRRSNTVPSVVVFGTI